MWSFANDPEFQPELDWIRQFVREEVVPLDYILGSQWNIHAAEFKRLVRPLQAKVKLRVFGRAISDPNSVVKAMAS